MKEEITSLFKADRITVFVVDGKKRELFSRFKSGSEVERFVFLQLQAVSQVVVL